MTVATVTILWALGGAFFWAATHIVLTPALARMGSFAAVKAANYANLLILGALGLWWFDLSLFRWEAFAWFAGVGAMNYSLTRYCYYTGIQRIGPARHLTIASLMPLPNLLVAVLLVGERPGRLVLAGTLLVVAGVAFVSYDPSERGWVRRGIGWSVASMLLMTIAGYLRKRGMNAMPEPMILTAWGALVAVPSCALLGRFLPEEVSAWGPRSVLPFLLVSLVFNAAQQVLINRAVAGQLSLAVPILSAAPVFGLVLSVLFLRRFERVTAGVAAGVLVTVAGLVAIALGRNA